jgi:hypothetical protein
MAHPQRTLKAKVPGNRNLKVAFFSNVGVGDHYLLVVLVSHSLSFKFLYLPCCFVNRVTAFSFMSYCSIISVVFGLMGEQSLIFSSFQLSSLFFFLSFFLTFFFFLTFLLFSFFLSYSLSYFLSFFPLIFVVYLGHGSIPFCAGSLHISKHNEIHPIVHHTNYSVIIKCLCISWNKGIVHVCILCHSAFICMLSHTYFSGS